MDRLLFAGLTAGVAGLPLAIASAQQTTPKSEELFFEEIVVVGSYLPRKEFQGPTQATVFTREQFQKWGVTNVADVLRYAPQQTVSASPQLNFGAATLPRLRGFSSGTTLVLINGRRLQPSALQVAASNTPDLNTIPLAAVERIEILSESASALYGADAVGGVINVVLRSDIEDPSVNLFAGTADGGAEETRGQFAIGGGDNLRGMLLLDFGNRESLSGEERERFNNKDFRRFGSTDQRLPFANPGTVYSMTGGNLPGLNSPFAAIPTGDGTGLTPADFLAGQVNLESLGRFGSVVPESERASALGRVDYSFTETLSAWAQLMYTDLENTRQLAPSFLFQTPVPGTNPFNPFGGAPVRVSYLFTGLGPQFDISEEQILRTVLGLDGKLGKFDWQISGLHLDDDGTNKVTGVVDMAAVNRALAQTDPNLALNVFGGPGGSAALLASLVPAPRINNFESQADEVATLLRGSLFDLPAGSVDMAVGAEYRNEEVLFDTAAIKVNAERNTTSAYTEFRIPLVSEDMKIPLMRSVTFTAAGRYDDYDDFGDTFNPQFGLTWQLVPGFMLRGSFSQAFRAPSLFELNRPTVTNTLQILDPARGNAVSPYLSISGGNQELQPEEADAQSFGFVIAPDEARGFAFSATYWRVDQERRIVLVSPNVILANEALFPDRVVRNPTTGALVSIDSTNLNFGRLDAAGVDLQLTDAFETDIGVFTPNLLVSWFDSYDAIDAPASAQVDRVDVANSAGSIPEWRATLVLDWEYRGWGLSLTGRHTPSYRDASFTNVLNGRTVDSLTLLDVQVSLDLDGALPMNAPNAWTGGWAVRLGATNVTDEMPPFSEVGASLGADPSQADFIGRFVYVGLSKDF